MLLTGFFFCGNVKFFSDYHIKWCRSFKRSAILKIPSTVLRRTKALSVGFKKNFKKAVSCVKTKSYSNFAVKLAKFFCLFDESPFSRISTHEYVIMQYKELNWLSDCTWTQTHNHLVHIRTLNQWSNGCRFESSCSHLNFAPDSLDFAPALSKEFLDIQAIIECGFTLKRVREMIKTYSQT